MTGSIVSVSPSGSSTNARERSRRIGSSVVQDRDHERAVDEVPRPPGLPPLEERPFPGQELIELCVHRFVHTRVDELGAHAVAAFDLVDVGDVIAGKDVRIRGTPTHLVAQPPVREIGEERVAVGGELGGVDRPLGLDLLLELGRAVVGVDEAVDMTAEPEREQE